MDSAIRETLRVHAPIHSIFRKVISDIPVPPSVSSPSESGSYVIPKGYYVLASPGVAQMDGRIWEDAGRWEPSRWTDKSGVAAKAGDAYDNAEGDKVDYGFGGAALWDLPLTVLRLNLIPLVCPASHLQGHRVALPAVRCRPTPVHWRVVRLRPAVDHPRLLCPEDGAQARGRRSGDQLRGASPAERIVLVRSGPSKEHTDWAVASAPFHQSMIVLPKHPDEIMFRPRA